MGKAVADFVTHGGRMIEDMFHAGHPFSGQTVAPHQALNYRQSWPSISVLPRESVGIRGH